MLANCVCNYTAVETHGLLITLAQEWSELRINSVFVHIRHTYNMAARYGNDVIHLRHCTPWCKIVERAAGGDGQWPRSRQLGYTYTSQCDNTLSSFIT